jgi:hypothetical protein
MQQVSELTDRQKALLGEYKKKWYQIAYSTQPINYEKATQALEAAYKQLAKVENIDIFFFESPVSIADLSFLDKVYSSDNWDNPKKISNLIRRVEDQFPTIFLSKDVFRDIALPLIEMMGRQINPRVWHFINKELAFKADLSGLISENLEDSERSSLIWEIAKPRQRERLEIIWRNLAAYKSFYPGAQCSDCCILDYCISELNCIHNENLWQSLKAFVSDCGWTFFYQGFCLMCDRPIKILLDDQNRPHAENKAAIEFSDGFKIFAKHGYSV